MAEPLKIEIDLREVLDGIRNELTGGFARVESSLSTKADKADLARLEARLEAHDREIATLRRTADALDIETRVGLERDGKFLTRAQRKWATFYAIASLLVLSFSPFLANLAIHH